MHESTDLVLVFVRVYTVFVSSPIKRKHWKWFSTNYSCKSDYVFMIDLRLCAKFLLKNWDQTTVFNYPPILRMKPNDIHFWRSIMNTHYLFQTQNKYTPLQICCCYIKSPTYFLKHKEVDEACRCIHIPARMNWKTRYYCRSFNFRTSVVYKRIVVILIEL